jgi:hypothetical protein
LGVEAWAICKRSTDRARLVSIEDLFEGPDQFGACRIPLFMAQLDSLAPHQRHQLCRQAVAARHLGTFHEDRHHANATGERRRSFDAHEVAGIIEATPPCVVRSEPVLADEDDDDFARGERMLDGIDKIDTRLDPLDIHKNAVGTEVSGEPIIEPTRITGRIVAPVADEYAVHGFGQGLICACAVAGMTYSRNGWNRSHDTRALAKGTSHVASGREPTAP